MKSGMGEEGYERFAAELARLRDALDDLRRRPVPLDVGTLRHVITASLAEASAPPPNLLVTAIRRLDRVDARLESMEALLGGPGLVPRTAPAHVSAAGRDRLPALPAPAPAPVLPAVVADTEAIAEALSRRLSAVLAAQAPAGPSGPGATVQDLLGALRPLVPDAARAVLRRAGREPSPQAVEVLQQTALSALEEAAGGLRSSGAPVSAFAAGAPVSAFAAPSDPRRFAPPAALAPAAPPAPPPPQPPPPQPPPLDVDFLASSIAARVAAQLRPPAGAAPVGPSPAAPPPPPPPPLDPTLVADAVLNRLPQQPPPLDPSAVADAVLRRLAQQPPPQAVVPAMAMAPLLSAVGNVEAAVAQITGPDADVVVAVDRLEAGVEALARAIEGDRAAQAEEVRRGFADVNGLLRAELAAQLLPESDALDPEVGSVDADDEPAPADGESEAGAQRSDLAGSVGALVRLERRIDRLARQLAPLAEVDLLATLPGLAVQGQRFERSLHQVLTALAAIAEHLHEQSATLRTDFDDLGALLGQQVSERLDRLARGADSGRPSFPAQSGPAQAPLPIEPARADPASRDAAPPLPMGAGNVATDDQPPRLTDAPDEAEAAQDEEAPQAPAADPDPTPFSAERAESGWPGWVEAEGPPGDGPTAAPATVADQVEHVDAGGEGSAVVDQPDGSSRAEGGARALDGDGHVGVATEADDGFAPESRRRRRRRPRRKQAG